jgi:hypothetical protein
MMNKLTTPLFLLLIALSLLGCPPAKNDLLLKTGRQSTTLEYLDSDYFEKQLSTAMSQKQPKIEVTVLSPFSTNDIPDRLDAWLTMIGETGGKIKTVPIDSRKNMLVSLLLTLHSVYQKLKKQFRYNPARHYNAQLLYWRNKSGDALIEKIIFTHRNLKPEKFTPVVAAAQVEKQPMLGRKHALLIGIENYPNVSPLRGAINDVKLIQGVLRQRFGFRDENFMILLDDQATHTGIEKAFRTLIEQVKPNDFVYIHYAGHGAQTADLNGEERSGQDETWVSFGSRQPGREKDNYDVLDDEIHTWLAAIYAKTDQVIFISDSCHSATVARGKVPVSRCLKQDDRPHPQGRMAYTKLNKYHGIHIGAARYQELAAETLGDDGKHYGLFTWHWAKALQQAQVGETWNDVFKRAVTKIVSWRGEAQRPQIQGGRYRQIFGEHLTPPVSTVSVTNVKGERVKIQAGVVAGMTVGSVYRLHQHPESLPRIEITQVGTFESEGKTTAVGAFKAGDLVIEESHAYHFNPIKVYLDADYPKDRPLLEAAFQALPGYALTDNPDKTDLRLHLLRPKRKNGLPIYEKESDALPKSFANQPPELWVLTPEQHLLYKNLQIQFYNPKKGVALLQDNLNKLARLREIKALQSASHSAVTVQTYRLSPVNDCSAGQNCVKLPKDLGWHQKTGPYSWSEISGHTLSQDDILIFTLHNQSEQDYYCYFIKIGIDGSISAIFPHNEEYTLVKAGERRELFEEVMEQSGEQTIKFIASTQPIDILLLEQGRFERREEDLNSLERLLVNAVHGQRGISRVSNSEWVTGQVTLSSR